MPAHGVSRYGRLGACSPSVGAPRVGVSNPRPASPSAQRSGLCGCSCASEFEAGSALLAHARRYPPCAFDGLRDGVLSHAGKTKASTPLLRPGVLYMDRAASKAQKRVDGPFAGRNVARGFRAAAEKGQG
jgi:hypothetical protein